MFKTVHFSFFQTNNYPNNYPEKKLTDLKNIGAFDGSVWSAPLKSVGLRRFAPMAQGGRAQDWEQGKGPGAGVGAKRKAWAWARKGSGLGYALTGG